MSEDDLRKIAQEEMQKQIMANLDSALIFKYISTLEEKNKELENADLTTVYMSGYYDGEKKWKDKIKAKIEDLKENSNEDDFNLTNVIMLFKSLLEKGDKE